MKLKKGLSTVQLLTLGLLITLLCASVAQAAPLYRANSRCRTQSAGARQCFQPVSISLNSGTSKPPCSWCSRTRKAARMSLTSCR